MNLNLISPGTENIRKKKGDLVVDISQVMRNLTGSEVKENKKSVLQKLLEPKEIDDSEKKARKAVRIAKKIARGEPVTPEEIQLLRQVDPKLAQMAELARKEGERIKHALQQASSKEEQQNIVQQAYQQVSEVSEKNPQFGMLLGEAVKAAIQEAKEEPKAMGNDQPWQEGEASEPAGILQTNSPVEEEDRESEHRMEEKQEEILEQFYKEEWMSMLDCKG
ncbi:MAG: hypothetical protein HFH41_06955 [Lachnospiraceae bacterium]|nr:hypothetical protein [Lachnospiraceae bacterium]